VEEQVGVRLSVENRTGFEREMESAADELEEFGRSSDRAGDSLSRFTSQSAQTQRSMGRMALATRAVRDNYRRAIAPSLALTAAIGIGVGGLGYAAMKGGEEFSAWNKVQQQTVAGIKSTGGAANVTRRHVQQLSERLEDVSTVDENLIQQGANVLLTFTKIRNEVGKGNDVFDRANKLGLDLSVRLEKDIGSSAIMLGKALNDPVKGIAAMSRAGVQFSEDQAEAIKKMVETGDILGAQKTILRELEKQVGGSAKAYGDSFEGMKNRVGDTLGDLARSLFVTFNIEDLIKSAAGWIDDLAERIEELADAFKTGGFEGLIEEAFGEGSFQLVKFLAGGLVGLLIPAVIATGTAFVTAFATLAPWFAIGAILVPLIIDNWAKIRDWTIETWGKVGSFISDTWNTIKGAVGDGLGWILDGFATFINFWFDIAGKILSGADFAFGWLPGIGDDIGKLRDEFNETTDDIVRDLRRQADAYHNWGYQISEEIAKAGEQWENFTMLVSAGVLPPGAAFSYVPSALSSPGPSRRTDGSRAPNNVPDDARRSRKMAGVGAGMRTIPAGATVLRAGDTYGDIHIHDATDPEKVWTALNRKLRKERARKGLNDG
jgi:hypothetical protein